jgi:hypothetical protein
VTVGHTLRQPRSGWHQKARHGSAGKTKMEQTESALADGTSLVTDSGFRDLGLFPETSVSPRFIIDCVLEDCVLEIR